MPTLVWPPQIDAELKAESPVSPTYLTANRIYKPAHGIVAAQATMMQEKQATVRKTPRNALAISRLHQHLPLPDSRLSQDAGAAPDHLGEQRGGVGIHQRQQPEQHRARGGRAERRSQRARQLHRCRGGTQVDAGRRPPGR